MNPTNLKFIRSSLFNTKSIYKYQLNQYRLGSSKVFNRPVITMLDIFKQEAAKQLSELSGVEANQIASWLEAPKDLKMGDLAAPIPRFRLKGNPVQFAQEFAGKVIIKNLNIFF
jgi:hypothetical protein